MCFLLICHMLHDKTLLILIGIHQISGYITPEEQTEPQDSHVWHMLLIIQTQGCHSFTMTQFWLLWPISRPKFVFCLPKCAAIHILVVRGILWILITRSLKSCLGLFIDRSKQLFVNYPPLPFFNASTQIRLFSPSHKFWPLRCHNEKDELSRLIVWGNCSLICG